jgi:hypothetical protein
MSAERMALIEVFRNEIGGLAGRFEKGAHRGSWTMPYRLFRPARAAGKLPLIVQRCSPPPRPTGSPNRSVDSVGTRNLPDAGVRDAHRRRRRSRRRVVGANLGVFDCARGTARNPNPDPEQAARLAAMFARSVQQ